ncbi:MAG: 2-oxo acid dehydrogenase subunit E2, partial [Phycisphaerales bacterium]
QHIPHFYLKVVVEAKKLFELYKKTKSQIPCSVNDFVVMACAMAIRQFPAFRSQYKNSQIIESENVNIGVAVGLDDGLVVPVLVDADKMNLSSLSARTKVIVENARNGKIDGMGKGIFTVTNLGMFGTEEFSAIINPPESAILAVGAIREDIKVVNESIKATRLMTMTLSVDHRVIDGVMAAKFAAAVKEILENPEQLIK